MATHGDELAERLQPGSRASNGAEVSRMVAELEDRLQDSERRILLRLEQVMEQVERVGEGQGRGIAGGNEPSGSSRVATTSVPRELTKEQRRQMAALACLAGVATSALGMIVMTIVKGGD